jgi:hypothetical protein
LETKSSYEDILARLNAHYSNPNIEVVGDEESSPKPKSKKRQRSSTQTDREKKKKKRKKDSSSDEDDENAITEEAAGGESVLKSKRVLYPKRTASKLVSLFSESDLNQILANTDRR